jgi:uncharacterized surface protein with fasciclin (FAS1) repeats
MGRAADRTAAGCREGQARVQSAEIAFTQILSRALHGLHYAARGRTDEVRRRETPVRPDPPAARSAEVQPLRAARTRRTRKESHMKKTALMLALSLAASVAFAGSPAAKSQDIVDTAVAAGSFKTLATALTAAGLVDTLKGPGPFTVFAPTDEAFAKLPAGTLESLLADKDKLAKVLTYHVVAGKVTAADVVKLKSAKTVQGGSVKIDASSGVKVDQAKVIQADVMASNGVIHVIDTVLLPN